jgi:hypothetical protein
MTDSEVTPLDVELCRQIVVARAWTTAQRRKRETETRQALRAAGLEDYLPRDDVHRYIIPADVFTRALTERPFTLEFDADEDEVDEVAATLNVQLFEHVTGWILENVPSSGTNDKAVNVNAIIRQHGQTGSTVWQHVTAEGAAELQRITTAVLEWGEEKDICEELERAMQLVGLKDFMPPEEASVSVKLMPNSEPIMLTVKTDRLGRPDRNHVSDALGHYISDLLDVGTITIE